MLLGGRSLPFLAGLFPSFLARSLNIIHTTSTFGGVGVQTPPLPKQIMIPVPSPVPPPLPSSPLPCSPPPSQQCLPSLGTARPFPSSSPLPLPLPIPILSLSLTLGFFLCDS